MSIRPGKKATATLSLENVKIQIYFLQSKRSTFLVHMVCNPVVFRFLLSSIPAFPIIPLFCIPLFQNSHASIRSKKERAERFPTTVAAVGLV